MGSCQNLSHRTINTKIKIGSIQFGIIIIFVLFVGSVSYSKYNDTLSETTKSLNKKIIDFHFETFKKLENIFLQDTHNNFIQTVSKNKKLRNNFEDMMNLIRISTVQNLFVVARNKQNEYYFLLDSERDEKKHADVFEPFEPLGNAWNSCYICKKPITFYHKKNKNLWITIIYPIVENNQTVALIGADISYELDIDMKKKLQDFTYFFFWLVFLSVLLCILFYILILYFRHKYYDGYTDPLTQVYNRKYLYDILIKKLSRSYQLFMIDIDFFKWVNDSYGHDAGDNILKEVVNRVESLIRDEDSLIRFGGEEFLIYTTTLSPEKSFEFAERIRKKIKDTPILYKDIQCDITISIGINLYATKNKPFEDMLIKADQALYEAKASGRDCVKMAR